MKVRSPGWQHDPRYGTKDWPAPVQTPNWNGPNATEPRTVTVRPYTNEGGRTHDQRLLDQQWRDAVELGLLHNAGAAINSQGPPS